MRNAINNDDDHEIKFVEFSVSIFKNKLADKHFSYAKETNVQKQKKATKFVIKC